MEATCPLTDGWRKEIWYIHNGILLSHKNEILPFATTWTDLANIMLSEISWKEKVKYSVITYIWNLKNKTNG